MAAPIKPCKFGSKCHRPDCWFSHPTPAVVAPTAPSTTPCKFGDKCTRADCRFLHSSIASDILTNEELAARNPAFAAALAAGMQLDDEELDELAIIALDDEIAGLELDEEIEADESN